MPAQSPGELGALMFQAIADQDVDLALSYYESEAVFVPSTGEHITGVAAMKEPWTGLLSMDLSGEIETTFLAQIGDIAMMSSSWTLAGNDPGGEPLKFQATSWEVARKQEDGTWKYIIHNSWAAPGTAVID